MIESNTYIINLLPNFTFNIKDLVIYKRQQQIPNDLLKTFIILPLSSTQKEHINLFFMHKLFLLGMMRFSES
jgi:hypothetical protein